MTPEEYQRYKRAEKEHLKKLNELKRAVHALERRKRIQSAVEDASRTTTDVLEAHEEMIDRLAMETARQEARLEVALEQARSDADAETPEQADAELRRARARAIIDEIKSELHESSAPRPEQPSSKKATAPRSMDGAPGGDAGPGNPTPDRRDRPEKTIGRM